jgi:hypothetical protein
LPAVAVGQSRLVRRTLSPGHELRSFDHLILQLAHVPDAFQNVSKDHHGEWTDRRILAEIEESDTPAGVLYMNRLGADALVFAYVLARFSNGNALYS